MAYNNGFPITYQPAYQMQPQVQQIQMPQPQQQQTGITWVQGEAGAKAYPVAPNTTVDLWDSEEQTIYLKSADMSGMPSMKILDYTVRDSVNPKNNHLTEQPVIDTSMFVTYDDLDARLEELTSKINALVTRPKSNEYQRRNKERKDG